jgi:hypothetical protein
MVNNHTQSHTITHNHTQSPCPESPSYPGDGRRRTTHASLNSSSLEVSSPSTRCFSPWHVASLENRGLCHGSFAPFLRSSAAPRLQTTTLPCPCHPWHHHCHHHHCHHHHCHHHHCHHHHCHHPHGHHCRGCCCLAGGRLLLHVAPSMPRPRPRPVGYSKRKTKL